MAKRTAAEFAHVIVRLAAAEDARRPKGTDDPTPKPRDWDKESARILDSFDDSTDPQAQAHLSAHLRALYDLELARLIRVREETPEIPKEIWFRIKAGNLARLVNAVYNVRDINLVRTRITKKGLSEESEKRFRVQPDLPEESVSADDVRTGRCPQFAPPRDEQDSFNLQTILNDLCFRGHLTAGDYIVDAW